MTTVSSGAPVSGLSASPGNPLTVLGGGTVVSAVVQSGGSETVSAGGTDSAGTVQSGGNATVFGSAVGTTNDGGYLTLSSGASGTGLVLSRGYDTVASGATASAAVVQPRAVLVVSGGSVYGTRLSGGSQAVYAGSAVSTVVGSGGADNVFYQNSVDSAATIEAGGYQGVSDGASAVAAVIQSGGVQSVAGVAFNASLAGIASLTVVQSGGAQIVEGAGQAISTTVASGGIELVQSAGVAGNTTIEAGGLVVVLSGGDLENVTIASGGQLVVLPQGTATIAAGSAGPPPGIVSVGAAGVLVSAVSASGLAIAGYTTLYVLSGGEAISTQATQEGGAEIVFAGGLSLDDTISTYATLTLAGGTASGASVAFATENVDSGGRAVATRLGSAGSLYVYAGGVASSASVGPRAELYATSSGSAFDTVVLSAGTLENNSFAISTVISSGGSDFVAGYYGLNASDSAASIDTSGVQQVFSGGIAFAATIRSGGAQAVWDGGIASSAVVQSGGEQHASSGGTAVATTIEAGGKLDVLGGGSGLSALVEAGGGLVVSASGSTTDTTIASGGIELVQSGGVAFGTTLEPGGELVLLPGGSASGTVGGSAVTPDVVLNAAQLSTWASSASAVAVGSGGTLYVFSGGTVSGATLSGGAETVAAGGSDAGAFLSGYSASLTLAGRASGETLSGGAILFIQSGGVATGVTVASRGVVSVANGGSASGLLVSDGYVAVSQGGTVTGIDSPVGGNVTVSGGTVFSTQLPLEGELLVTDGGSAFDTRVGFIGFLTVGSGAVASGIELSGKLAYLIVDAGATVEGGVAIDAQSIADIGILGTTMPSATISGFSGPDLIDLAAVAYDPAGSAFYSGGTLTVSEGGQSYALDLQPASTFVGGSFVLTSDGASGTLVQFVGSSSYLVASGGTGTSQSVPSGNELLVRAGGISIGATLGGDGPFMTYQLDPADGGTLLLDSTSATQGEEFNAGTASGTVVQFGGNLLNEGKVIAASIASGGLLFNNSGSADAVVVGSGGIELDENDGSYVFSTVVDGGLEGLADGAIAFDTTVNSGGVQVIGGKVQLGGNLVPLLGGTAESATVNAGGAQFVNQIGSAISTRIDGGRMVVNAGGTAVTPLIGASGTLDLESGGIASGGIAFAGAAGLLAITGTALPTAPISGFAPGDSIDLAGIAPGSAPSASLDAATQVLTIHAADGSFVLTLAGAAAGTLFDVTSDTGSGSLLTELACFAAGTRIATDRGEVAVEELTAENHVYTQSGRLAPVRWVGRRLVDCRRHPRPEQVMPVRIAAGAFGPGLPARALELSPDHAVFVDSVLIPVRHLANGGSIAPVRRDSVTYYHVELDRHDVLLAERLPTESFLDTGNRAAFADGGCVTDLHPDFSRRTWDAEACAPLVLAGPRLERVRRRLAAVTPPSGGRVRPGHASV